MCCLPWRGQAGRRVLDLGFEFGVGTLVAFVKELKIVTHSHVLRRLGLSLVHSAKLPDFRGWRYSMSGTVLSVDSRHDSDLRSIGLSVFSRELSL